MFVSLTSQPISTVTKQMIGKEVHLTPPMLDIETTFQRAVQVPVVLAVLQVEAAEDLPLAVGSIAE